MARKAQAEEDNDEPGLDISSLIDICFLLLIYFLVTTTIQKKEQDIQMTMPSNTPSEDQPDIDPLFIRVTQSGAIAVGSGASSEQLDSDPGDHTLPLLKNRLLMYKSGAGDSTPVVQLYVEGEALQQRVVDVMNALSDEAVDITSVTFTDLLDN